MEAGGRVTNRLKPSRKKPDEVGLQVDGPNGSELRMQPRKTVVDVDPL
jgi:hypothetical protein